MKTLIIHPKDKTTKFLEDVYLFNDNVTVVTDGFGKRKLIDLIRSHKRVIIMGHGTEKGLLNPNGKGFIIDSRTVFVLRNVEVIGIWCHANQFFEKYGLKGFATSMFISDFTEAMYESVLTNFEEIEQSNKRLADALRNIINYPIELIEETMVNDYPKDDKYEPLYEFNYSGFKTFL